MTPEQRRARQRMRAHNVRPIRIFPMYDKNPADGFRYQVARAAGRLPEYWKEHMRWGFSYSSPAHSYRVEYWTFRTFREACDKVREIFKETT